MDCIFFHPRDSHTKGSLVLIHPGLEGITEVETDPKGGFVSFKVTSLPLMTEFCVYVPSGYSTREQLARERFFKGLQNYMENKIEGKEKKKCLETLIVLWIKWMGMVEIKHKNSIDAGILY